jgi:hypothetical protein
MDYNGDLSASEYRAENPFDRRREVGPSRDVPTHRIMINGLYEIPAGRGRRFCANVGKAANLLVGGWEFSGMYTWQTGPFLTPQWTGTDPVGINYTTSATTPSVTLRPNVSRNPNLPSEQRTMSRWFDTSVFSAPLPGQFGSAGKGIIVGPGTNGWNAGVFKKLQFSEKGPRLRWEFTATNLLNHPNWGAPGLNMSTPTAFGKISSTQTTGLFGADYRQLRTALRLEW